MEIQECTAEVFDKKQLAENIYHLTFKLINPTILVWSAGQYLSLKINTDTYRSYSICNTPNNSDYLEIVVDASPGGLGSLYLLSLSPRDKVSLRAPIGNFVLPPLSLGVGERSLILCATGTGVGPFRAMLSGLLEEIIHKQQRVTVYLFFGLRNEKGIYFKDFFKDFESKYSHFKFNLVLSQPESETWQGLTGNVTEHVLALCDWLNK